MAPGEVFSAVVARHYGRAELTLIDFVKSANPDVTSIDELRTGQRLKLPVYEPGKLVEKADGERYRLHLMTTWDNQDQVTPEAAVGRRQAGTTGHRGPRQLDTARDSVSGTGR